MSIAVKICGITDKEALHAVVEGGASYIGFVFVRASKRYITLEKAQELLATLPQPALCRFAPASLERGENDLVLTALFVDPTDEEINAALRLRPFLGLIQLHGNEAPDRVSAIRSMTGLPVMKAVSIATNEDFNAIADYEQSTDMLLFDTKTETAQRGGTGKSFDWSLLADRSFSKPWMLAGGLNIKNIKKAIKQSGATIIDLSSGVETDGQKDPQKIRDVLRLCNETL